MESFKAHSAKQSSAIFTDKRFSIIASGIQFGKTIAGVAWLKMFMHKYIDEADNFLVCSPTYKILAQSTLPPFLQMNKDCGKLDKQTFSFKIHGGGTVWFRTGTDPDSVVGITRVRAILCDEAGLFSLYFWQNITARASFSEAPVMIVTSPYSLNWLYTDFIRPYHKKDPYVLESTHLVQARSDENPYFPRGEYEARRRTMDPKKFNMIYGGSFEKAEGLVYKCFNQDVHEVEPFAFPAGTRYFAGVDWGYTDPFVIVVRAITPDGYHWSIAEYCKTQQTLDQMIEAAIRMRSMWPIERFECDPSRPEYIASFCQAGLTAVKANNEIRLGIDRHYELIASDRYHIFKGSCPATIDEYETYHYPLDKELKPDQDSKDFLPVDKDNHCCDAQRYVTNATFNIGKSKNRVIMEVNKQKVKTAYVPFDREQEKLLKPKKEWEH